MAGVKYRANLSFQRNPIPDAKKKVAGRQGALIRTIARRSLRRRKAVSQPGRPPTSREGTLKKFLFFSWDAESQSVFVGPEKLGKPGSVPHVLEYGGMGEPGFNKPKVQYKARPYMRPALDEAMAQLPELWRNAVN